MRDPNLDMVIHERKAGPVLVYEVVFCVVIESWSSPSSYEVVFCVIIENERWSQSRPIPCLWLSGQDDKDLGCHYRGMSDDTGMCVAVEDYYYA